MFGIILEFTWLNFFSTKFGWAQYETRHWHWLDFFNPDRLRVCIAAKRMHRSSAAPDTQILVCGRRPSQLGLALCRPAARWPVSDANVWETLPICQACTMEKKSSPLANKQFIQLPLYTVQPGHTTVHSKRYSYAYEQSIVCMYMGSP
jgi:hypothetical protein